MRAGDGFFFVPKAVESTVLCLCVVVILSNFFFFFKKRKKGKIDWSVAMRERA